MKCCFKRECFRQRLAWEVALSALDIIVVVITVEDARAIDLDIDLDVGSKAQKAELRTRGMDCRPGGRERRPETDALFLATFQTARLKRVQPAVLDGPEASAPLQMVSHQRNSCGCKCF